MAGLLKESLTAPQNNWIIVYSGAIQMQGGPVGYICGPNSILRCIYKNDPVIGEKVQWIKYSDDGKKENVLKYRTIGTDGTTVFMDYTIASSGHYACGYDDVPYKTLNLTITISSEY